MKIKKIISNFLLAFVIFSIGFAFGKVVSSGKNETVQSNYTDEKVVVYYFRTTFRCWQCNMIESNTNKLIEDEYKQYLESGLLEWQVIDFLKNSELSSKYNIVGNTVVIVRFGDGEELEHVILDKVMEIVFNEEEFFEYIRAGINSMINPDREDGFSITKEAFSVTKLELRNDLFSYILVPKLSIQHLVPKLCLGTNTTLAQVIEQVSSIAKLELHNEFFAFNFPKISSCGSPEFNGRIGGSI